MSNTGLRAGETIDQYVARLEAALAEKSQTKLTFKLSDKGVISASLGRGFPTSASAERWLAILDSKEFRAFVEANADLAKETRKEYMATDAYKADAAKIAKSREEYKLAKAQ